MQIGCVGQGHFLTQGYEAEASELSSLWLSDVKGQPLVHDLCVSPLPGPRWSRQARRYGNLHWTGGGSAHLPCEAVLEVSLEWLGQEERLLC